MIRFTRFAPVALLAALAVLVAVPLTARAGDGVVPQHDRPRGNKYEARIDEMIGAQVPLEVALRDENDQPITLKECINDKPTILVPVYYRCPMLCTEVLNGLLKALREMPSDFSAGGKFNVITISMDPKEHGGLAREKKKAYLDEYGRPGAEAGWRFLTGTKESLAVVLDSVGYRFEFDKMLKEYNHPSALVILSPQGKVTRYFYGIGFDGEYKTDGPPVLNARGEMDAPRVSLRLSLIEAAEGKGGSMLDKVLMLCYRYDKLHQGYSLNVLRVIQLGGVLTLLGVGLVAGYAFRREGLLGAAISRVSLMALFFFEVVGPGLIMALWSESRTVAQVLIALWVAAFCLFVVMLRSEIRTRVSGRGDLRNRAGRDTPPGPANALPSGGTA